AAAARPVAPGCRHSRRQVLPRVPGRCRGPEVGIGSLPWFLRAQVRMRMTWPVWEARADSRLKPTVGLRCVVQLGAWGRVGLKSRVARAPAVARGARVTRHP